jgi:hypothetical protein
VRKRIILLPYELIVETGRAHVSSRGRECREILRG